MKVVKATVVRNILKSMGHNTQQKYINYFSSRHPNDKVNIEKLKQTLTDIDKKIALYKAKQ